MSRLMKDEVDAVQKAKHTGIGSDDGNVNGRNGHDCRFDEACTGHGLRANLL